MDTWVFFEPDMMPIVVVLVPALALPELIAAHILEYTLIVCA